MNKLFLLCKKKGVYMYTIYIKLKMRNLIVDYEKSPDLKPIKNVPYRRKRVTLLLRMTNGRGGTVLDIHRHTTRAKKLTPPTTLLTRLTLSNPSMDYVSDFLV